MKKRCNNPNDIHYYLYGGRGIFYVAEWETFLGFFADMGMKPGSKYSLDRIDTNGPYCKENCRWADAKTQARNQRSNVPITSQGETKTISEWAEELGFKYNTLQARLKKGWSDEHAITKPVRHRSSLMATPKPQLE